MVMAAKASSVPVAVHLDHGISEAYIEKALKMGFRSVMFDGSSLPFDENVEMTKRVVEMAHRYGASVEAVSYTHLCSNKKYSERFKLVMIHNLLFPFNTA